MIRNIIFDLFGVIARFDTEGYYTVHGILEGRRTALRGVGCKSRAGDRIQVRIDA